MRFDQRRAHRWAGSHAARSRFRVWERSDTHKHSSAAATTSPRPGSRESAHDHVISADCTQRRPRNGRPRSYQACRYLFTIPKFTRSLRCFVFTSCCVGVEVSGEKGLEVCSVEKTSSLTPVFLKGCWRLWISSRYPTIWLTGNRDLGAISYLYPCTKLFKIGPVRPHTHLSQYETFGNKKSGKNVSLQNCIAQ